MPVDQTRAQRLVFARKKAGLERPDAAARLGIPYSTYGNYEDGHRGFSDKTGRRIAKFLKINFDWLQTGIGLMQGSEDPLSGLNDEGRKKALEHIDMLKRLYPE